MRLKRSGEWGQPCLIPDTSGKSSRFSSLSKTCCVHAQSCPNLGTLWTVACQAPLSMVFSRQEFPRYQISSSRVSSQPRYQTCASWGSWTAGRFFTAWAIKEAPSKMLGTVFFFFLLDIIEQVEKVSLCFCKFLWWVSVEFSQRLFWGKTQTNKHLCYNQVTFLFHHIDAINYRNQLQKLIFKCVALHTHDKCQMLEVYNFFIQCWIQYTNILLRMLASMFLRDLVHSFLVMFLFSFDIKLMLAS